MEINKTVEFFKSIGFKGELNEKGNHFTMDCYTNSSHFDVQGNDKGYVLVRLIDRKHIADFLEINNFDEKSFDITKQTIKFWDNF